MRKNGTRKYLYGIVVRICFHRRRFVQQQILPLPCLFILETLDHSPWSKWLMLTYTTMIREMLITLLYLDPEYVLQIKIRTFSDFQMLTFRI